ncbi:MAG: ABC transporter ATP-binding protein [Spirochaetales bacterium]|nr:ABC transporter ATP-binding protein [Spirochaetales bacterium]
MISLKNIAIVFNKGTPDENLALNNINLSIKEGDFITIIGSNGAGKSTLFNIISGSYFPTSGTVSINNIDVTRHAEYKRAKYIGRIFQNPLMGTAGNMSLEDNMMISYKKGFKWPILSLNQKMRQFFQDELKQLDMGLENRLRDNVGLFSGGQRQALTLLMMVLSQPALILLDEHTAALDPKNAALVLELTSHFVKKYNLTTMMITHNMNHAIEYGNRLFMMDKGEVIFDVQGEEKKALTQARLIEKFHEIRHSEFDNDKVLLSQD